MINENYSGIIINENNTPTSKEELAGFWITQNIFKPGNFAYGAAQKFPELSGFQVLCETGVEKTNLLYNFAYNQSEVGQVTLVEGESTKAIAGERTWVTVYFPEPIPTTEYSNPNTYFVISLKKAVSDPIAHIWKNESNLNYRLLGLTVDHGTDFLGNSYRSLVEASSI